ncbi:hypothetical protein KCMC57_up43070 [Kitasatospora sp. CMC57]
MEGMATFTMNMSNVIIKVGARTTGSVDQLGRSSAGAAAGPAFVLRSAVSVIGANPLSLMWEVVRIRSVIACVRHCRR